MDETVNKWLWIGIGAVVCIVILLFATPLGDIVKGFIEGIVNNVNGLISFS